MDRTFGVVAGVGAAVMLAALGALYGAASHWTSFSDWWLTAPSIGAIVVVVMVAESLTKRRGGEGAWPLPMGRRLPYLGLCAGLGALSAYLAYFVVTLGWEPDRAAGGSMALLFHPDQFVTIYSSKRGGTSTGMGVVASAGLMAGIGLVLPALWMRRK